MNTENPVNSVREPSATPFELSAELEKLGVQIVELYDTARHQASQAGQIANEAIKSALLCGHALNKAKSIIKHGKWLTWLANNCPEVTERTAEKWMKMANSNHGSNLESCAGLRRAYIECGILPEPELKPFHSDPIPFYARVIRDVNHLLDCIPKLNIADMPDSARAMAKQQLRPLVELYESL